MKKYTLTEKIIKKHLVSGTMDPGSEIGIRIDQTLTQDATGTIAYLQFEALGIPRVKTKCSVSYIDHNTLQTGFENADDHRYLQSVAARYGIYFSRPGNGICHQVHLERFGVPGQTLLGSDSHTPTAGGLGMLAIGAGGLNVAVAMGGGPFYLTMPRIVQVRLSGKLSRWINAKDVILEILKRLTVKGGVNKVFEYTGDGVRTLDVPERSIITNMGAELGATTSIFPSDSVTKQFFKEQKRPKAWTELLPDPGAVYAEMIDIDLAQLQPMVAKPHMPDNVVTVRSIAGLHIDQVCIGSCTNSSLKDLVTVAAILKGKKVHPGVSLIIAPGSRSVYEMIARNGALNDMLAAGARIAESACGFCIGMGHAPGSNAVSLRTSNRNFKGRSGTASALIYIVSPETAAYSALQGRLSDPRKLTLTYAFKKPARFIVDERNIIKPSTGKKPEVLRGPNIKPLPRASVLGEDMYAEILLKTGDNITTDHIMPAGATILPLRSNIPAMAEFVFSHVDPTFAQRAIQKGGGIIVGGENYGQGSSREHAALAPMYLKVKAVVARSFARIHLNNLINFGILPLIFTEPADYDLCEQGDVCSIEGVRGMITGDLPIIMINKTKNKRIPLMLKATAREKEILIAGGLLNYTQRKT